MSGATIPRANLPEPDERSQDPDEGDPDKGSRPNQRCTKNRMVVVDNYLIRRTMKFVNHVPYVLGEAIIKTSVWFVK